MRTRASKGSACLADIQDHPHPFDHCQQRVGLQGGWIFQVTKLQSQRDFVMLTQMVEVSSVLKHVSRTLMSHCYLLMRSSSLAKGSLDKDSVISHSLSASGWTEPFSPLLARGFQLFKTKSFSIIWENVACLCPGRWYGNMGGALQGEPFTCSGSSCHC